MREVDFRVSRFWLTLFTSHVVKKSPAKISQNVIVSGTTLQILTFVESSNEQKCSPKHSSLPPIALHNFAKEDKVEKQQNVLFCQTWLDNPRKSVESSLESCTIAKSVKNCCIKVPSLSWLDRYKKSYTQKTASPSQNLHFPQPKNLRTAVFGDTS